MMASQSKWIFLGVVIVGMVVAFALGIPARTLLFVGVILLCPLSMYFMMGNMNRGSGRKGMDQRSDKTDAMPNMKDEERQKTQTK